MRIILPANFVSMQSKFCVPGFSKVDIKSSVVSTFYQQWTKVILPHAKKAGGKIGFLDFFSGPGKSNDGTETTPVSVLRYTAECSELSDQLIVVFNDKEPKNTIKLRQLVTSIEGVAQMRFEPRIEKGVTYEDLVSSLQIIRFLPSLVLIDPLNIRGFSFFSFSGHIKDLNLDCIICINYSQLERIIENPFKEKYLESVFGKQAATLLRSIGGRLNSNQKEYLIMKTLMGSLKNIKGYHSVLLKYRPKADPDINYQIFITKYSGRFHLYTELLSKAGYQEFDRQKQKVRIPVRGDHPLQPGLFGEKKEE